MLASPSSRAARTLRAASLAAAAGVALSGCHTVSDAISPGKTAPDEFRVVTKAPLVVPPDYALRPPAPGEPRPQELQPESQAEVAMLGQRAAADRDEAERMFVAKAGADKADPLIRYVMDDQFGDIAHKDKSFADRVMFWRKGDPQNTEVIAAEKAAETPAPLDPATVQQRIASLTGDKEIVIQRAPENKHIKLPGL